MIDAAIVAIVCAWPVELVWDHLIHGPQIGFWQSFGVVFLAHLFGGFLGKSK